VPARPKSHPNADTDTDTGGRAVDRAAARPASPSGSQHPGSAFGDRALRIDVEAYYDVKDAMFDIVMAGAEAWAARTGWAPGPSDA
jgi:hypothetical protein